jgi:tetratricopeptide (TPR) repeat protein
MLSKEEFITTFFHQTDIPVAPSMERALGYFGAGRWVAFQRSRKLNGLAWADDRLNVCRSASTVWDRFLSHPFVAPYLQVWRPDMSGPDTLHFESEDDDPDAVPEIPEADDWPPSGHLQRMGYAIVLDRSTRGVYITSWEYAFHFLTFYGDADLLEEGGEEEGEEIDEPEIVQASDWDDEPLPVDPATEQRFLAWLDRRWNNANDLYRLAVQHCRYRQYSEALKALGRALEIRPDNAVTNWMASQVYGKLKRWPESLEACQKAIKLHTTTGKELPAETLFMWQGECFFMLSRYREAIESFKLVTDLKPDHADAYYELGQCHTELENYAEAAASHEQEIKLRISSNSGAGEKELTKLSRAYEELGMAYYLDLCWPEAERAFRHAIALTPDSLQAHEGLVAVYEQTGNGSEQEKEQRIVSELEAMPASTSKLPSTH